ncbi:MAG: 50S ribosomal protein L13 [Bdellovibrionaceae bacterium]|nr:50S ribosomal protein L13 [Pseudobdellovibrionaceae bacterium]NUM57131.1 50S ribosomal protein L13 [Pseudobdellovibrionaceae bacterium]
MKQTKTFMAKSDEVSRKWYLIDAADQKVGRLATHIANLLRGKHKPTFTPHADAGDFVVVINTDKLVLTGTKWETKKYYSHSRFFGSMKEKTAAQMKQEDSAFIIQEAVRGMLPTNKMSRHLILKMKAYPGAAHEHAAQKPEAYKVD